MAPQTKLLLTGASGFLGATLLPRLGAEYAATPMSRTGRLGWVKADLTDGAEVTRILREIEPEIVVHAAAWTSVDGCERDQAQAYAQNVLAAENLVAACAVCPNVPRIVFISTDQMYDGPGPHSEDSPVAPRNFYALTKLWAESIMLRAESSLVLRSNFFGAGREPREGLASWLLDSMGSGDPVTVFYDVLFNPLYVEDFADLLLDLIRSGARGIVNLGAGDAGLSKAEFAYALAERFSVSTESAKAGSVESIKLSAVRPRDMRMNVDRLRALLPGRTIPTVMSGIDRMYRDAGKVRSANSIGAAHDQFGR